MFTLRKKSSYYAELHDECATLIVKSNPYFNFRKGHFLVKIL